VHCVYPLKTGEVDLNNTHTLGNNLTVNTSHVTYEVNLANGLHDKYSFLLRGPTNTNKYSLRRNV